VVEAVKQSLANAVEKLSDAGIPMNRSWGEIQFSERSGERLGIHGGSGAFMFNAIYAELVKGEGYSRISAGNSYMQAVTWDESDCPDAYGILSYSQSSDPASEHYADATRLYSDGGWIDMPFCEADRDAQEIRRETIEE
jgi:acyl-homoserine-lactone acylase